jgi:hypothetical protein
MGSLEAAVMLSASSTGVFGLRGLSLGWRGGGHELGHDVDRERHASGSRYLVPAEFAGDRLEPRPHSITPRRRSITPRRRSITAAGHHQP